MTNKLFVHLSYGDQVSVNGCTLWAFYYDDDVFCLILPSLDYLIVNVLEIKKPKLIKADIAHAFLNIRVDLGNGLSLCVSYDQQIYMDNSLAIGTVNGTAIFQRITHSIRRIMPRYGITI